MAISSRKRCVDIKSFTLSTVEKIRETWKCSKCGESKHTNMVMCDNCEIWFHW